MQLFELLPVQSPTRFQGGSNFFAGVYKHGGVVGLHKASRLFPLSVQLINFFLHLTDPSFEYSSFVLSSNVRTSPHRDQNNAEPSNLCVAISHFEGGGIWVHDSQGSVPMRVQGRTLLGSCLDVASGPCILPAKTCLHATMPWDGHRLVLIAYSGGPVNQLSPLDYHTLLSLGFSPPLTSGTDCPPLSLTYPVPRSLGDFESRARARIASRHIESLIFVEVFAGAGGFCAAVRALGMQQSFGVDHQVLKGAKCPLVVLDLSQESGQQLLFELLSNPAVVAVHLGPPPCGTSSAALPLRSAAEPHGLPNLSSVNAARVRQENILYDLTAKVVQFCYNAGILFCLENPSRSVFWLTSPMLALSHLPILATHLHHCMVGSSRKKATTLKHVIPQMQRLQLPCSGDHEHEPWGRLPDGSWSAAAEVHYSAMMCCLMASSVVDQLIDWGAAPAAVSLSDQPLALARAAQVAADKQPSGKKIKPLVSEFKLVCTLRGPAPDLPSLDGMRLAADFRVPTSVSAAPSVASIPAGSRCLRVSPVARGFSADSPPHVPSCDDTLPRVPEYLNPSDGAAHLGSKPADAGQTLTEMVVGIYRDPHEFLKVATACRHPRSLVEGCPPALKHCITSVVDLGCANVAKERTATLRKWVSRAKVLKDAGELVPESTPKHCKDILRSKNMCLFREMLEESQYGDTNLTTDLCRGFDLLGPIPCSGVLPEKVTPASLTKDEVRLTAAANRKATLKAMCTCQDKEVAAEVYKATLDEKERGWLIGPVDPDSLPESAILTRRFGVVQSTSGEGGVSVKKVRPIDDFTQSLANLTTSSRESIAPHGVDSILAGLILRIMLPRKRGQSSNLKLRTIDLRKAYKQLPLSEDALLDAHICVHNPHTGLPEIFQTRVLPFGARPAVQGFCRTSAALWWLGTTLFRLHWTIFFDDFTLVGEAAECVHLDFVQAGFFQLLGWETSKEKDSGFSSLAKALGVEICLGESHLGLLSVQNTEARKRELANTIAGILLAGGATAKEFECLRGRLLFAEGQIFGRGANQSFKLVSSACRSAGFIKLSPGLISALTFLRDRIVCGPPRKVRACARQCYHLYTDASLDSDCGGLGAILYSSSSLCLRWFSEHVELSHVEALKDPSKEGFIYELETFAAVQGLVNLCAPIKDADVILYVDNEAALGALIKCRSGSPVVSALLRDLCNFEDRSGNCVWFERIPSASNPADAPSRFDVNGLPPSFRNRLDVKILIEEIACHIASEASR